MFDMKQIDRIKNMTTSEMAEYLDNVNYGCRMCSQCLAERYCSNAINDSKTCKQTIKDYLESEVPICESSNTQTE
jgi:hypothetical protein